MMAGICVIWDHMWGLYEESSSSPTGVSKGMIGPRRATSWAHEPVDIFHVHLLESMIEPTMVPAVINIGGRTWSHHITGLMDSFL